MIVSIHQPQYMPWPPYFSKIARADTFIFLDNVQFQKNGLHNRNELKNSNGRFWLTAPVSAHLGDKLKEVKTVNAGWSKKHIKSIYLKYGKSINYYFFTNHIQNILEQDFENLVDLNIKIIKIIIITILVLMPIRTVSQSFDPETGKTVYSSNKYISVYMGYGPGSLESFYAESAFSSPENPSERLWTANVLDVSTENSLPQLGLKFGGWKGWFGGELEMSLLRHKTPAQIVYYDSHGQIFIPPTPGYPDGYYYTIEPQDSVALPDNFLNFNSYSIGGIAYLNIPFIKNINPTIGFGLSFAMNNVKSEYPGPGSFAAKNVMAAFGYDIKDSQSLNTTDFGWGFDIPIGLKYRANDNIFFSADFRLSKKYISFVGSDAYLKEKDETVLQSFQINLGVGKFIN